MRPTWRGVYRVRSRIRRPAWIRPGVPTTPILAASFRRVPTMLAASRWLRPCAMACEARVPVPRRAMRAAARVAMLRALTVARRLRFEAIICGSPLVRWSGGEARPRKAGRGGSGGEVAARLECGGDGGGLGGAGVAEVAEHHVLGPGDGPAVGLGDLVGLGLEGGQLVAVCGLAVVLIVGGDGR